MGKKKRKKVRVPFRRNRQKRAREKDLTRRVVQEDIRDEDQVTGERVSGKGELTRHRTIMGVEDESGDEGQILLDVDESECLHGRVISALGLNSIVQGDDGQRYECTVRKLIRNLARDKRNAVVTGDHVLFRPTVEDQGVIERVNSRHGTLSRVSHRREHVLVANVDQVLIVVSAVDPHLKPGLIDRFLISAEKGHVGSIVCINKVDLADPVELQPIVGLYSRLGYDVVLTSATLSMGIARLRSLLQGRETVLSGQSGVGKSSLLNAIQPGLDLQTAEISQETRKGRHTTRYTVLLPLDFGGWVVDTPGIRQLDLWDVLPEEVEGYLVEFRPFVPFCKFPDCSHSHEDDCGVKQAVARDLIAEIRYESYLRILAGDVA